jgi:predicted amidohydrolase
MIVAAAQISIQRDNVSANLQTHLKLIEIAAANGVQLLVFPELSLTGYAIDNAPSLAFEPEDERLIPLKKKAVDFNMIVVAGAPIRIEKELYIGAFIFLPHGQVKIYTKQHLHGDEGTVFSSNVLYNPRVEWEGEKISFAICADITHPSHPASASKENATIYTAGICYTPNGIEEAHMQLSSYAREFNIQVVMANYVGPVHQYNTAGRSAIWDPTGKLIAHADGETAGLLRVDTKNTSIAEFSPI